MAKVNQPIKEFWESDKKPTGLEISKRKLGKIPPTHNVRFKGKIKKINSAKPRCGLCGKRRKLVKTQCCGN